MPATMLKLRLFRVRNALVRECMAEFLGTFILLVRDTDPCTFHFSDPDIIFNTLP